MTTIQTDVLKQFAIPGKLIGFTEHIVGHIHATYISTWEFEGHKARYVHQQINKQVFSDVALLMKNLESMLTHLQKMHDIKSYPLVVPELIKTHEGRIYTLDAAGSFWRTFKFIEYSKTYNTCISVEHAYEAGRCFGLFHKAVNELPVSSIQETIPFFMDSRRRIAALEGAIAADPFNRSKNIKNEIDTALNAVGDACVVSDALTTGAVPLRVVHGDMKLNNLLFHETQETGLAIVDLDTCMPGSWLYDFGDLARTIVVSVDEDEKDLTRVQVNTPFLEKLTDAYVQATNGMLTQEERNLLSAAPRAITLTIGIRFLTDYLQGDTYFKIHYPDQNLVRARCQFAIAKGLMS